MVIKRFLNWYFSNFFKMFETAALRKKYPYLEFFYSVFSRIRTEYEEILCFSLYSVQMREKRTRKTPNRGTFHAFLVLKPPGHLWESKNWELRIFFVFSNCWEDLQFAFWFSFHFIFFIGWKTITEAKQSLNVEIEIKNQLNDLLALTSVSKYIDISINFFSFGKAINTYNRNSTRVRNERKKKPQQILEEDIFNVTDALFWSSTTYIISSFRKIIKLDALTKKSLLKSQSLTS